MTTADIRWTEPKLLGLIEARFCSPEWATLPQVANGTGWRQRRWLDAVSMNLYPSRGLELHGFEVKVSRGDWKRELADPQKIEDMAGHLDRLWIVAPAGLIDADDLPARWGLLVTRKSRKKDADHELIAKRKAPLLHGDQETGPMARTFVAALLRRAEESATHRLKNYIRRDEIAQEVKREHERGVLDGQAGAHAAMRAAKDLQKFEEASGIKVSGWLGSDHVGKEFGAFLEWRSRGEEMNTALERKSDQFRRVADLLDKLRSELPAAAETTEVTG